MKKYCIVMVAIGEKHQRLSKVNRAAWKKYADRVDADLYIVEMSEGVMPYHPAWAKIPAMNYFLGLYSRAMYADADTMIDADETPNLFDLVPREKFGIFLEGFHSERFQHSLRPALHNYNLKTDRIYDGEYGNTGIMVATSEYHRDVFTMPDLIMDNYYEQGYLNAILFAYNVPIYNLPHHFNRMSLIDHICGEELHKSFIVHWAGSNDYDSIEEQMKEIEQKFKYRSTAKTRLYCCVGGGLGDAATCEPIFRYAIENVYKNDVNVEFHIYTYPEYQTLLRGLKKYKNVFFHDTLPHELEKPQELFGKLKIETPHREMYTHPHDRHAIRMFFPYPDVHNQDYGALCMLQQSIHPRWERQPIIPVYEEDRSELSEIIKKSVPSDYYQPEPLPMVVVHPGIGWPTKTFPVGYWQAIIERLSEFAFIVLMGKNKVLDVNLPANGCGVDLRNKIETRHVLALLEKADLVISNDSSPVHMAAAYDNYILMIATCKRPELVMPYRRGTQEYKALAVYHRLTCEELERRPTNMTFASLADLKGDIRDYLPSVDFVVRAAERMVIQSPKYLDAQTGWERERGEIGYSE